MPDNLLQLFVYNCQPGKIDITEGLAAFIFVIRSVDIRLQVKYQLTFSCSYPLQYLVSASLSCLKSSCSLSFFVSFLSCNRI